MYLETYYIANMVYDAIENLQGCRFDSFSENRDGSIKVYLYFTKYQRGKPTASAVGGTRPSALKVA